MNGRRSFGGMEPSHDDEPVLVESVAPLLATPAVWIDPPHELAGEVIEALQDEIG